MNLPVLLAMPKLGHGKLEGQECAAYCWSMELVIVSKVAGKLGPVGLF